METREASRPWSLLGEPRTFASVEGGVWGAQVGLFSAMQGEVVLGCSVEPSLSGSPGSGRWPQGRQPWQRHTVEFLLREASAEADTRGRDRRGLPPRSPCPTPAALHHCLLGLSSPRPAPPCSPTSLARSSRSFPVSLSPALLSLSAPLRPAPHSNSPSLFLWVSLFPRVSFMLSLSLSLSVSLISSPPCFSFVLLPFPISTPFLFSLLPMLLFLFLPLLVFL